jgi:Holliday junction DNA helicase RuvA
MIGALRGEVIDKSEESLIVDVGGVGYVVLAPVSFLDEIQPGQQVQLFTHLHVREQELTLFGFSGTETLELFRTLIKVQGIGPKVALAILSHIPGETLRQAVAGGEAGILTRVPGIGAKKAKQIVFQLKDKIGYEDIFTSAAPIINDTDGEVIAALTALGYSVVEAQSALQQLPEESRQDTVEEKIRAALGSMARL